MIYYTIYKITNDINNKIYIGKHKTKDPYDDYIGSGKYLRRAINKYGSDMFEKEILYIFDNEDAMNLMEGEIVDEEFVARLDTYNLKVGGEGGWEYINNNEELRVEKNRKAVAMMHKKTLVDENFRKRLSESLKMRHKEGKIKLNIGNKSRTGQKLSEESKRKIGRSNSKHQKGKGNSQYGTCWIHNEVLRENKKIKKEVLSVWLDKGWIKGRKMRI